MCKWKGLPRLVCVCSERVRLCIFFSLSAYIYTYRVFLQSYMSTSAPLLPRHSSSFCLSKWCHVVCHCMKDSRDMRSEVDAYKYFFLRTPVMFNGRFILVFIERNQLRILSGSSTFWLKEE